MALGIVYERVGFLNAALSPVFKVCGILMSWVAAPIDWTLGKANDIFHAISVPVRWSALAIAIVGGGSALVYFYGLPDLEGVRVAIRDWADGTAATPLQRPERSALLGGRGALGTGAFPNCCSPVTGGQHDAFQ